MRRRAASSTMNHLRRPLSRTGVGECRPIRAWRDDPDAGLKTNSATDAFRGLGGQRRSAARGPQSRVRRGPRCAALSAGKLIRIARSAVCGLAAPEHSRDLAPTCEAADRQDLYSRGGRIRALGQAGRLADWLLTRTMGTVFASVSIDRHWNDVCGGSSFARIVSAYRRPHRLLGGVR